MNEQNFISIDEEIINNIGVNVQYYNVFQQSKNETFKSQAKNSHWKYRYVYIYMYMYVIQYNFSFIRYKTFDFSSHFRGIRITRYILNLSRGID